MAAVPSEALLDSVRMHGSTDISPEQIAAILGLQLQDVALYAGVHRNTLYTHPESPSVQDWLRKVVRVLRMAEDINGDRERARYLFKNEPIPPLGYHTALDLVRAGRFDDLAGYLESVADGFAG